MAFKIKERDPDIEREQRILTGMVVSTDCIKGVAPIWEPELLINPIIGLVGSWCVDYFTEYGKAPNGNLKDIFNDARGTILKDETSQEFVRKFLVKLSKDYEEGDPDINPEYMLKQAEEYFRRKKIEKLSKDIQVHLKNHDVDEAEGLIEKYKSISKPRTEIFDQLKEACIWEKDLAGMDLPAPERFLSPWLTKGSYTMIYGTKGIGKSWLSLIVAMALTRKGEEDIAIGPWELKRKAGVLLVDAEMRISNTNKRIKALAAPLEEGSRNHPLYILSNNVLGQKNRAQIDISKKEHREAITSLLINDDRLEVLILDNKASLAPGIDENSKADWDPVNQWILSLLNLGISVILVHHANKSGSDRGTSALTDNMDTVIKLTDPAPGSYRDGAFFKISFDKGRNLAGEDMNPFTLRVIMHEANMHWLTWSVESSEGSTREDRIKQMILNGESTKSIAAEAGISDGRVSQIKKKLKEQGYMDKNGVTKKGQDYLAGMEGGEG